MYSMKCSCGDVMKTNAADRNEAVSKIKAMMSEDAIAKHMAEKHAGQPVQSKADVDMQIEQQTVEGDLE